MIQVGITERGDAAINKGWSKWVSNGQPCILITKDAKTLIENNKHLFFEPNLDGNVILHATITGLGGTEIEPNVKSSKVQISYLESLLKQPSFHKERLVIRLDPIIIPFALYDSEYRQNILDIVSLANTHHVRLRISFFDYYPHVRYRFEQLREERWQNLVKNLNEMQPDMHIDISHRKAFLDILREKYTGDIEICGEPGLPCTGCLSQKDLDVFGISLEDEIEKGFQRPACACLGLKKELLDNKHPCKHNCQYCYWKD